MREFVEYIIKNLVDHPEDVFVKEIEGESVIILEIHCNQNDVGKIVGKKGNMINAIRTLAHCLAARNEIRVLLEIIEQS